MAIFRVYVLISLLAPVTAGAGEWSARVGDWEASSLNTPGMPGDQVERQSYHLRWRQADAEDEAVFSYAHEPVLVRIGRPATNGYLHRFGTDWTTEFRAFRIDLGIGFHASSNLITHTTFHEDALVGRFHVGYPLDTQAVGRIGIAGDHSFGKFLVYPTVAWRLRLAGRTLHLELPTRIQWGDKQDPWHIELLRYGRKWGTLDRSESVKGRFYLSEWRFETSTRLLSEKNGFSLNAGGGISFDTRLRYLDLDRGYVEVRQDPAAYLFLAARW